MDAVLFIIYMAAGYWAVNKVFYENKIVIYTSTGGFIMKKLTMAMVFGWILIPIAIIKTILFKPPY